MTTFRALNIALCNLYEMPALYDCDTANLLSDEEKEDVLNVLEELIDEIESRLKFYGQQGP